MNINVLTYHSRRDNVFKCDNNFIKHIMDFKLKHKQISFATLTYVPFNPPL